MGWKRPDGGTPPANGQVGRKTKISQTTDTDKHLPAF